MRRDEHERHNRKVAKIQLRERPLALGEERLRQVVKGTPAVFAAVAFEARSVMISTPGTNLLAVAMGTLQGAIFPPQRMDIGMARVGMEELVELGEHRHDGESPVVTRATLERIGRFSLCITLLPRYKLR
jgi:hypothetical protein